VIELLRRRNFALLWLAGLISVAGDYALVIALPLHAYRETGSTIATAGVFAASVLPRILIGSVAGVFVDRWDRKRTMIWADLLRAAAVLALIPAADAGSLWPVLVVATVQSTIGLFFDPAENALLPLLVEEDQLVTANALNALNNDLGRLVGPVLGASLYAASGLGGAAIADSITYLGSAALLAFLAPPPRQAATRAIDAGQSAARRVAGEWRAGMRIVRQSRALTVIFVATAISLLSEGAFAALALAPFVLDVLGGTETQVGWLSSAQAVGGLIAGVTVARFGRHAAKRKLLGWGMIGLGLSDMAQFNVHRVVDRGTPAVTAAMGCMFVAGFPAVGLGAGGQSLIQELTDDEYRGRVFGALGAVRAASLLIGLGISGVMAEQVGIAPVLTVGAAMWLIGGAIVLTLLPRAEFLPEDASSGKPR
jgi:MFS family permease